MDAQDFCSLQEAYMEVYGEAYKPFPKGKVDKKMASKAVKAAKHQFSATWGNPSKSSENQEKADKLGSQAKTLFQISTETNKEANARSRGIKSKHRSEVKRKIRFMDDIARQKRESGYGSTTKKEEVDIYDIILSHLLDEGYAETPEAAEVIMVNMSEDWRESIVEEMFDEGAAGAVAARAQQLANQRKNQTPKRKEMYQNLAKQAGQRERGPHQRGDNRTGMTSSERERRRDAAAYHSDLHGETKNTYGKGGVTKNPRKLAQQQARGQHAK